MAGRDLPVLNMFEFVISKVERDLLLNQISPSSRNDKNKIVGSRLCQGYGVHARPDTRIHFLCRAAKKTNQKKRLT